MLCINLYWTTLGFSWGIFGHMTCLDQLCACENIMDYKVQLFGYCPRLLFRKLGYILRYPLVLAGGYSVK